MTSNTVAYMHVLENVQVTSCIAVWRGCDRSLYYSCSVGKYYLVYFQEEGSVCIVDDRQIVGDKESSHVLVKCGGKKYAAEVNAYFIIIIADKSHILCVSYR